MTSLMTTILIVVVSVILFVLVIMIHEFGHFLFAKLFGVKVNEFAIGMGPKLLKKQKGETLYSLRLFPIGGFCAMEGEDEDSDDDRAFGNKKVWQRMIIVIAGAAFNIILGLIFMLIIQGQQPYYASRTIAGFVPTAVSYSDFAADTDGERDYLYSEDEETYLTIVEGEGNAAGGTISAEEAKSNEQAGKGHIFREAASGKTGLKQDDVIISVNDYRALCFYDAYFAMSMDDDGVMDFVVERDGERVKIPDVTFDRVDAGGMMTGTEMTVLDFQVYAVPRTFKTLMQSTYLQSQYFVRSVYMSLYYMITGRAGFNQMSGPVGIASMIGEVAEAGFAQSFMEGINSILYIMALITFNLGIVNLLPLPALDGGRFVFLVIEAIRRKPINQKIEGIVHTVGLLLLFGLMIVITYQDIIRLITSCSG
ncbi:MAG: RIP metalloprotease RseP [Ruminococcaceae bacterium]|nr:RIP metalloprotease RseP [Oscillospiraceae bacterium]